MKLKLTIILIAAVSFGTGFVSNDVTYKIIYELQLRSLRAGTWAAMFDYSPTANAYFQGMAYAHLVDMELIQRAQETGDINYVP